MSAIAQDIRIPVTIWLTPDAYRVWNRHAEPRGVEVGALVTEHAEQAARRQIALVVRPRDKRARGYRRLNSAERARARELYAAGHPRQAIAETFGCSLGTIFNHTRGITPRPQEHAA